MDTEENIKLLVGVLQQTFSVDAKARKAAEDYLTSVEGQPGYSILLLKLLSISGIDPTVQQSAGILFKNLIKRHWMVIEGHQPAVTITENDRRQIKTVIVDLMLSVPAHIQKQLAEALSIISNSDFPAQWPELLPTLVAKFETKDFKIINGVLETANSIFRRYRHQYKSDSVLRELQYILGLLQEPLLKLAQATSQMVEGNANAPDNLRILFTSLEIIFKIFYSLCYVDLPEYFEDHMQEWMMEFHKYLNFDSQFPQLVSDDDDEEGILQTVQATICENVNLYIGKYEEEFAPFLATFVEDVWKLLVKIGAEPKYDSLVSSAIGFLNTVSTSVHYELFKDLNTLKSICEKIVIPNMEFRESDEEIFEDNPIEYIRRDIEGSDSNTRRRSACELVKGLRKHYEEPVTQIFSAYIGAMLEQYSKNPKENWKSKDAAIYLVTALTVTSSTSTRGAVRTNQFIDIVSFFGTHILPELQGKISDSLVLKADALKFATSFRAQLPKEAFPIVLQLSVGLLENSHFVIHTYAAVCIERLLTVKIANATGQPVLVFGRAELKPFLQGLLINLLKIFTLQESKENDYVMKAFMRVLSTAGEDIVPAAEGCVTQLNAILSRVYKNPTNPTFNHYLFESLAVLIRNVCLSHPTSIEMFEKLLFPAFQAILQEDVAEFAPYVFQLMAYMLELHKEGASQPYLVVFPVFLTPVLWTRTGNVPALVRLLQAYLKQAAKPIVEAKHLEAILGVFQKLIASTVTDHEGFFLLESVILYADPAAFQQYLPNIFTLIFTRLQSCKTMKFIRSFLVFLSLFVARHGASAVVQLVDAIQPQLFSMVLESLWFPNIQKVSGNIERKMCAIAMTKLLTDCPQMLSDTYFPAWGKMLQTLIVLFEEPEDETLPPDMADNYVAVEESSGYSTAYSQLIYAAKQDVDPFKEIDARQLLVHSLKALSQAHPGKFAPLVQQYLQGPAFNVLGSYFQKYGVSEPYLH